MRIVNEIKWVRVLRRYFNHRIFSELLRGYKTLTGIRFIKRTISRLGLTIRLFILIDDKLFTLIFSKLPRSSKTV
jgi:hypothetical protein